MISRNLSDGVVDLYFPIIRCPFLGNHDANAPYSTLGWLEDFFFPWFYIIIIILCDDSDKVNVLALNYFYNGVGAGCIRRVCGG